MSHLLSVKDCISAHSGTETASRLLMINRNARAFLLGNPLVEAGAISSEFQQVIFLKIFYMHTSFFSNNISESKFSKHKNNLRGVLPQAFQVQVAITYILNLWRGDFAPAEWLAQRTARVGVSFALSSSIHRRKWENSSADACVFSCPTGRSLLLPAF